MSLYRQPNGNWRYHFMHGGQRYTKAGFLTKAAARSAEAQRRKEVIQGITSPALKGLGLSSLVFEYLDANQGKMATKTWKYKRYALQGFLTHAKDIPVAQVNSLLVNSYLKTRPSGHNANVHRKELSAMFAWGMKHGLCQGNPALQVEKFQVDKKEKIIPTPEEIARIFMAAGEHKPFLQVIFFTMGRRDEVLRLRWRDINFDKRIITLYTKKRKGGNYEADTLPVSDELYKVLADLWAKRVQEEWVFFNEKTGTRYNSRPKIMRTLCKRAGTRHFGFHAIRHFVPSYMLDVQKVSMKKLQHLLRHTSLRTTERYLHSVDSNLREAVNELPAPEEMVNV